MEMRNKGLIRYMILFILMAAAVHAASSDAPTNMAVDFYYSTLSSNLKSGESVILNLRVENTGDYAAKNVELWIPDTAELRINKRYNVGSYAAGEEKNIPVWIDVKENANTGLTGIQVYITYDGYDSDGDPFHNEKSQWEIPVVIYGDPLFQITPEKTTFYMDSTDELNLEGYAETPLKDLQAEISSDCITVIGSSKKYIGDTKADDGFNLVYDIKPSAEGVCELTLTLSYIDGSGTRVTDEQSIGLIVEEAGVDFKIVKIEHDSAGPGETVNLRLSVKNVGKTDAKDTTMSLSLSDPFTTADTSEKYVGDVAANETVESEFNLAVSLDAEAQVYTIPLDIEYKVGGTSYTAEKTVGVNVGGQVVLEIINVESSGSSLRIDVVNLGTRIAEGVKATLVTGADTQVMSTDSTNQQTAFQRTGGRAGGVLNMLPGMGGQRTASMSAEEREQMVQQMANQSSSLQQYVDYKSDIKASKQTTFTFDTMISGSATLILEYNGPNNERVTQVERVTVAGSGWTSRLTTATGTRSTRGGTDYVGLALYAIAALMILYVLYKAYGKWKTGTEGIWGVKGYAAAALIILLVAYMALYGIAVLALLFLAYKAYEKMKSG